MGIFGKKKKKEISEEEKQRRYKRYYDFGAKISMKLGLPQKVAKANAFYAKHPKSVSFIILGFLSAGLLFNIFFTPEMGSEDLFGNDEHIEYISATPLVSAIDKQRNHNSKIEQIVRQRDNIKAIVDSLSKMETLTPDDSMKLELGKEILKKIGEYKDEKTE